MKKIYLRPFTEVVNLKLSGSVLGGNGTPVIASPVADPDDSFGKENNGFFDMDDNFGDIWDDDEEPKDPWKE